MFILYFALWVILNGRWTPEIGAFGVVFAAVAYAFSCKFIGYSPSVDVALIRRVPGAVRYGVTLLREIVKANVTVIRMILDKDFEPEPQLVHFYADLKRGRHLVTLANSITLTPGTITVDLQDNRYLVHCLDQSLVEGLNDGVMISMLEEMERSHPLNAPAPQAGAPDAEDETSGSPAPSPDAADDIADKIPDDAADHAAEPAGDEAAQEQNEEEEGQNE